MRFPFESIQIEAEIARPAKCIQTANRGSATITTVTKTTGTISAAAKTAVRADMSGDCGSCQRRNDARGWTKRDQSLLVGKLLVGKPCAKSRDRAHRAQREESRNRLG